MGSGRDGGDVYISIPRSLRLWLGRAGMAFLEGACMIGHRLGLPFWLKV